MLIPNTDACDFMLVSVTHSWKEICMSLVVEPFACICDSVLTLGRLSGSGLNTVSQVVAYDGTLCCPVWFIDDLKWTIRFRVKYCQPSCSLRCDFMLACVIPCWLKWTVKFKVKYYQPSCGLWWYLMLACVIPCWT